MPVSVGFHPYFQLTDSPRDEWTISVGARTHLKLTPNKLPTGETEPIGAPYTGGVPLRDYDIDDGFSDLVRDAQGRATMTVSGKAQRLDVQFGPNYRARSRLVAEAAELHLLRADGGDHQRAQPRAERDLQGTAAHRAWRHVAREFLDSRSKGLSRGVEVGNLREQLVQVEVMLPELAAVVARGDLDHAGTAGRSETGAQRLLDRRSIETIHDDLQH